MNATWTRGSSPLDVSIPDEPCEAYYGFSRDLDARAEGYHWKRIPDRWKRGGELVVPLERGGDVTVYLPPEADFTYRVELRNENGGRRRAMERPARFRVPAGHYEVLGYRGTVEMFRKEVTLRRRQQVTVELVPSDFADVPAGPAAGGEAPFMLELAVPPEWNARTLALQLDRWSSDERRFEPIGAFAATRGDTGPWTCDAGRQLPGVYRVRVEPMGLLRLVRFDGTGSEHFEVRPPVDLRVRAVVARTWDAIEGVEIGWQCSSPAASDRSLVSRPCEAAADGVARAQVPTGSIVFRASADGFEPALEHVEVRPGQREVVLALRRSAPATDR